MAKTSNAVKYRYNQKAYDYIQFTVPKGQKDPILAHAARMGESAAEFIRRAIANQMEADGHTLPPENSES